MSPELLNGLIGVSLVLYVVMGGADFGGGVWDALAHGPRRREQRALIERALGPIWEANHVWLILVVVLLFTGFPRAFAAISIAFHMPLTLLLIGIVFRGSAFTFRSSDSKNDSRQRAWGLLFSLASVISPLLLGMVAGATASGQVTVQDGMVQGGYFAPWLSPFPIAVGALSLSLCAFLAATYLTVEASDRELSDEFRRRALGAGVAVGASALTAFLLSAEGAPLIHQGLTARPWSWVLQSATAAAAITAFWALWRRRFRLARVAAALQASLIVVGWGASQYPYLVVPDLTVQNAAANGTTLAVMFWILAANSRAQRE